MGSAARAELFSCECMDCDGLVKCQARSLLPTHVKPMHYSLHTTPNLEAFTFTGTVRITLVCSYPTSKLVLHAHELNISRASLAIKGKEKSLDVAPENIVFNETDQTVSLTLSETFQNGTEGILEIDFSGILNDKMHGFYRSHYTNRKGEDDMMAVTQFESSYARYAFPCWDEPKIKATFDVTLRVKKGLVALSNMPATKETDVGDEHKDVAFSTTPVMSTYLLAFVVGDLDSISSKTKEGVEVNVWTPPGLSEQGRFACDVAAKVLSFFSEYFDSKFPLPKMDMVSVPDFEAGAMENWGLVTYRTVLILYDEKTSSASFKQRVCYVVCHELAHQWFGNLVTMEWWTDLWLNEGFATWVGWLAVESLFPDWGVWEQFTVNEQGRALQLDALKSSHPVEVEIGNSEEALEIFDAISYSKGSAVVRMLHSYLGPEVFRDGMRRYIAHHKYKNAATRDLWDMLEETSKKPVKELMQCWTQQTGYPVVSVRKHKNGSLDISQQIFLSSGEDKSIPTTWLVPLRAISDGESMDTDVLKTSSMTIPTAPTWIKINSEQCGFYRVSYDDELLDALAVKLPTLGVADRVGVISDTFALASAGYSSSTSPLKLMKHYADDDSYVVWSEITAGLSMMLSVWFEQPSHVLEALHAFAASFFSKIAMRMGWVPRPGEKHTDAMLRALVISKASRYGDPAMLSESQKRFEKFVSGDSEAIHPDLRPGVFASVLAAGGNEEFDALVKLYTNSETQDLKVMVLQSLGTCRNPEIVQRALDFALSDAVRFQDAVYVIGSAAANPSGRRLARKFLEEKWGVLHERYGQGMMMSRVFAYCTDSLTTEADALAVESLHQDKGDAKLNRTVAQTCEQIRASARWLERDAVTVAEWIKTQSDV